MGELLRPRISDREPLELAVIFGLIDGRVAFESGGSNYIKKARREDTERVSSGGG